MYFQILDPDKHKMDGDPKPRKQSKHSKTVVAQRSISEKFPQEGKVKQKSASKKTFAKNTAGHSVQICIFMPHLGDVDILLDELAADNLVGLLAAVAVEQGVVLLVDRRLLLLAITAL